MSAVINKKAEVKDSAMAWRGSSALPSAPLTSRRWALWRAAVHAAQWHGAAGVPCRAW